MRGERAAAVAEAAGWLLVWRGATLRGLVRVPTALAGAVIVRAARRRRRSGAGGSARRRRQVEVVEVNSPAELEPGIASASPRPTFPDRIDPAPARRPPERRGGRDRR
jgi:hypothetical protein